MYLTVTPAYGRDYRTEAEVKKDWSEGKDFIIATVMHRDCGRYINKQDAYSSLESGSDGERLIISARYNNLTEIVQVFP